MNNRINLADIPPQPSNLAGWPITTRPQILPLGELSWEDFERLCIRLVRKEPDTEFAQSYGVKGQDQEGIDFYVRTHSSQRYKVWQCKRHRAFSKADVVKAVQRFIRAFRTKNAGIPIKETEVLVLAVTADLSNVNVAKEIERQHKRLKRWYRISLIAHDVFGISDKLKSHPDIVSDFFHPNLAEAFCGRQHTSGLVGEFEYKSLQTNLRVAQEGLSSSCHIELDRIRDLWGERRENEALAALEKFKAELTWPLLNVEVQSKALRIEAGLRLQNGDIDRAQKLCDESKKIAPAANARVLEAKLVHQKEGAEAALAFLKNPTTDDELVFRWNLLLELSHPKEITDEFASLRRSDPPGGDFSSILALAQLAQFDLTSADKTIKSALQRKPRHVSSRYVSAIIDYFWGISTAFHSWRHLIWPLPPPRNLVKRDVESRERRLRAAKVFEELAATVLTNGSGNFRVWQLACVLLNSDDATEPRQIVVQELAENPASFPMLLWASVFQLEFKRAESMDVLQQRLKTGGGSLEDLLALLGLVEDTSDLELYERLITEHRSIFVDAGRAQLWYLYRAQLFAEQGQTAQSLELLNLMPENEMGRHYKSVIESLVAQKTGRVEDYQLLATTQEADYQSDNSPEKLWACCRTHRQLQRWDFIAQHAQDLVSKVNTQGSLEMAAEGLLRARQPEDCLALLNEHRALCERGELTPFLRQLAAESHRLLGNLPAAISQLERAAAVEMGVGAKIQLFQTQKQKGDLTAALQTARLLSSSPDVPTEFLIGEVIPVARHHDTELAKDLILKMESSPGPLSPQAEMKLLDEAGRLGVESTFQKLFDKLTQQAMAGKGPLKAFTLEEAREMFSNRQKLAVDASQKYACGEMPLHILASALDIPLARLLHEAPRRNIKLRRPLQSQALFSRYAGEANLHPRPLPKNTSELYLDISSLLLIDALGLLPFVETAFNRLHIGSSLIHCLEMHLDQLSPRQPSRIIASKEIVQHIEAGKVSVLQPVLIPLPTDSPLSPLFSDMGMEWCQRLSQVKSESGLFVDFLPLCNKDGLNAGVELPAVFKVSVVSVQQLFNAMHEAGWITSGEMSKDFSTFRTDHLSHNGDIHLSAGMFIHLNIGQAEELALAGVFETLCKKAKVTIESSEAEQLKQRVSRVSDDEELKKDVQRLLAHLSSAIGKAKYQVHVGNPIEQLKGVPALSPAELSLCEAFDFANGNQIPICVDDRAIRRHMTIEKSPLLDSWDILHHLKDSGIITDESYRYARSNMRAANLRYLPVSVAEIVSSVRCAPIQNDILRETPELECLRRYVAATLLDRTILQNVARDPKGNIYPREAVWVAGLQTAITKALIDVWLYSDPKNNHAYLQADWIWFNLFFDERLSAEFLDHKLSDQDVTEAMARKIATLFSFGIGLYEPPKKAVMASSKRKRYFRWLNERVITPLLPNNPDIWRQSGKHLQKLCALMEDEGKLRISENKENDAKIIRHLVGAFIIDLPAELADGLGLKPEELNKLGLAASTNEIELLGISLAAKDFWEAIARALEATHATVWTSDRKSKLRVRYDSNSKQVKASAKGGTESPWCALEIPFLQLLSANQKQWYAVLLHDAKSFDLDEPHLSKAIQEIAAIPSAYERIAKRVVYQEQSAVCFYEKLEQDIRSRKGMNISDLLPKTKICLRRYLRLESSESNGTTLSLCGDRLKESVGWTETAVRLSRIPGDFPYAMMEEWSQLTAAEQKSRLDELKARLVSPIERLHFLQLLLCPASTVTSERLSEAKEQLRWLCDVKIGLAHGHSMLAIVSWVYLRLGWDPEASTWPAFDRLTVAWSHGCALYRLFQTTNISPEFIEKWFANNSQEFFAGCFVFANETSYDAANPIRLKFGTLILKGVASACACLSEEQIQESAVKDVLTTITGDDFWAEHIDMWADRSLGGNLLESYLANLSDEKLRRVLSDPVFDHYFRLDRRQIVESALDELLKNHTDSNSTFVLNCVVGGRPMFEDLRDKVISLLAEIDFVHVYTNTPNECGQLIMLTSQLGSSLADAEQINKIWNKCLLLADHLAVINLDVVKNEKLQEILGHSLADTALRFSSSREGRKAGVQIFIHKLIELAKRWPGFANSGRHGLTQALNRIPPNELAGLSELVSILRANA